MDEILQTLLASPEPSVRYKVLVGLLAGDTLPVKNTGDIKQTQLEVQNSTRVQTLLSQRGLDGRIPLHPYAKWNGAHWVLATLADLGYPPGDDSLIPMREQILAWLLSEEHWRSIRTLEGRVRRCASQEGNAIYALLSLGLVDDRVDELVRRLLLWQWADGGWNCDKKPGAINSSFFESLIPLRALALYAKQTGSQSAANGAERAADVFLKRNLFRSRQNGHAIRAEFLKLHYPCYWHYDILFGLKVMAEAGFIGDSRCEMALNLLEGKRLPDGGFPAEASYYRIIEKQLTGRSLVDWGGVSKKQMNPFVTADALAVLHAAGRC